MTFYLMPNGCGRVVEREHEPEGALESYSSLREVWQACSHGDPALFREVVADIVDEIVAIETRMDTLRALGQTTGGIIPF